MPRKPKAPKNIVLMPLDEILSPWERIENLVGIPVVLSKIEFRTRIIGKQQVTEATFEAWKVTRNPETDGFETEFLGVFLTRSVVLIEQLRLYKAYVEETGQYPLAVIQEVKTKNGRRYYSMLSGEVG